jgi:hypothetical protein
MTSSSPTPPGAVCTVVELVCAAVLVCPAAPQEAKSKLHPPNKRYETAPNVPITEARRMDSPFPPVVFSKPAKQFLRVAADPHLERADGSTGQVNIDQLVNKNMDQLVKLIYEWLVGLRGGDDRCGVSRKRMSCPRDDRSP